MNITAPTTAVSAWIGADYDEEKVIDVLYSVVVAFGGGHRIWGRFHNQWEANAHEVNSILVEAHRLRENDIDTLRGILRQIRGLGGLSYGTKMLRFLNPNHVVLDSRLREEFGLDESDYTEFAGHCRKIAETLGVTPVDVESGLFTYIQIANPNQRNRYWKQYLLPDEEGIGNIQSVNN